MQGLMPGWLQNLVTPVDRHQSSVPVTPGEAEWQTLVERRYRRSRDSKQPYLRTWATSLAFYVGEHYRQWDDRTKRLVQRTRLPSWRVLLVDNQIPGLVEMAAARLGQARSFPKGLAGSNDPNDVQAAVAATKALEHWWQQDEMDDKELEANIARLLFGCAFYRDYWDPNRTAKMDTPFGPQKARVGDVSAEVLSVFDVFPEAGAERWNEISWCIVARKKPLWWLTETFGETARRVQPERGNQDGALNALLPGAFGPDNHSSTLQASSSQDQGDETATLLEYYERPCGKYEKGRHAMVAGGVVLYAQDALPQPHGEIPVTMSPYRLVPKRLWPMGLIEHVIGLQRELNRGQSYVAENLRFHARPKWLVAKGSKVDPDAITSAPDEVIEYVGEKPSVVSPPSLPAWVDQFPDKQRLAIQQVAGFHEVSNATVPSGVSSGVAIGILAEQDNKRLGPPAQLGKSALERLGSHQLQTMVARYRETRLIATLGANRSREVLALQGADLAGVDVFVEIGEGVSDTAASKRQRILDYKAAGLFDLPYPVQVEFLRAMQEHWLIEAMEAARAAAAQQSALMAPDLAAASLPPDISQEI